MASTYLTRSNGTPTSQQIFTFSAWVKRSGLNPSGNNMELFSQYNDTSNRMDFRFQTGDTIDFYHTSSLGRITTNRLFRDTSAWYHIVLRVDTTQATSSDRYRLYINGVQETSFSTATYPSQNANLGTNFSTFSIGDDSYGSGDFDGCMTHIHYTDGQSYDATAFGETDATTGEWKIKTSPSVTYGNNGFFILKDGNSVTDQSGNGNNFTVGGGTLTNTEDNPSNVFCTLNPLSTSPTGIGSYFSNGNNTLIAPTGAPYDIACGSTLGVNSGKWYWEVKYTDSDPSGFQAAGLGIYDSELAINTFGNLRSVSNSKSVIWDVRHDLWVNGSDTGDDYTVTSGSILGFALDLDAGTLKIHENGTYYNSGNAVTSAIDTSKTYLILASANGGSNYASLFFNFGNGYFGTTPVSSAGTNASGNGIFEYDVPTGYTALSTKGLNL